MNPRLLKTAGMQLPPGLCPKHQRRCPKMQDLSHLANPGFPSYGSSMAGGNTVTDKTTDLMEAVPGSKSEGTADVPTHDNPNLEVGKTTDKFKDDVLTHDSSFTAGPVTWKKVP